MNSLSTSDDTKTYLSRYPELGSAESIELMQNWVPKINANDLSAANFPDSVNLEWCPPGHGDVYASLFGTGTLDRLIDAGIRFAFISNSDNLGATLDLKILNGFKRIGASFFCLFSLAKLVLSKFLDVSYLFIVVCMFLWFLVRSVEGPEHEDAPG